MNDPPASAAARATFELRAEVTPAVWLLRHIQALVQTVGRLARAPLTNLATVTVIGIALALPAGLAAALDNVETLRLSWDAQGPISLFLAESVNDEGAVALARELERRPEIGRVHVITRAQALAEYESLIGAAGLLEALGGENPLPAVLVVEPSVAAAAEPARIARLVEALAARAEVDFAQFDMDWLGRLDAVLAVVRRALLLLAAVFALGALLIIGNTIRLAIEGRAQEIEVARLVGATDAFVRRPFLWTGLCYGLLGAALAWALVAASFALLTGPVVELARLYESDFRPAGPSAATTLALFAGGALLGVAGAWVAVSRRLRADPAVER